jgi:hypothetical protein
MIVLPFLSGWFGLAVGGNLFGISRDPFVGDKRPGRDGRGDALDLSAYVSVSEAVGAMVVAKIRAAKDVGFG